LRALVVSDEVNALLYSPFASRIAGNVDLILSCGDLPMYYLDYLVSTLGKPLLYVCGNHDRYGLERVWNDPTDDAKTFRGGKLDYNGPACFGGKNIDMRTEKIGGMLFGGLEGSLLYNRGEHQYSEKQMRRRILRYSPGLAVNRIFEGRSIDVLITHAPPFGIHDAEDLPHRGFDAYRRFIRRYHPKYLLHGHTHIYDRNDSRITEFEGTKVINCFNYQILDLRID